MSTLHNTDGASARSQQPPPRETHVARNAHGERGRPAAAFVASARATARLLVDRRLALPRDRVGQRLHFADATTSTIFRETVLDDGRAQDPALLVVRFRLRLIGRSRLLHALFRLESIANTPLFAGFPGFRSKLWLTDPHTGVYRGVYEWEGARRATAYAETLSTLLRRLSVPGTVEYRVVAGVHRDDFVCDPTLAGPADPAERWWRLRAANARTGMRT